jgi:hypothetical protein
MTEMHEDMNIVSMLNVCCLILTKMNICQQIYQNSQYQISGKVCTGPQVVICGQTEDIHGETNGHSWQLFITYMGARNRVVG